MTRAWHRISGLLIHSLLIGLVTAGPACDNKDDGYEILQLEGKVEAITVKPDGSGEITVLYFSEKHGQEISGAGVVTKETEITINGVLAKLEDVREGERIRGEVRVERQGGEKKQTVLKIYVDRATSPGG